MKKVNYDNPERLADVMALIQVLALAEDTKRSENGLNKDLQRSAKSGETWTQVAEGHPEFFRVRPENVGNTGPEAHRVSLIARAVVPKGDEDHRDPLPSDLVSKLLDIAISLHDRERARRDQWKSWLPVAVAIILGLSGIAAALLKRGS